MRSALTVNVVRIVAALLYMHALTKQCSKCQSGKSGRRLHLYEPVVDGAYTNCTTCMWQRFCMDTVFQKSVTSLINSVKNEPILIIFGTQNPEGTSHKKIIKLFISYAKCSHCTLWEADLFHLIEVWLALGLPSETHWQFYHLQPTFHFLDFISEHHFNKIIYINKMKLHWHMHSSLGPRQ